MAKTLLKLKQLEALANNNRALISGASGGIETSAVTSTELSYLDLTTLGTAENSKVVTADAGGKITLGSKEIEGSAFDINGGAIDGATLGANSQVTITNADMNGGSIDGVTIGAASQAAGSFAGITLSSGNLVVGGHNLADVTVEGDVFASDNDHIPTAAAVKKYVDALSAGLRWLKPVDVASTAAIGTSEYDAGTNAFRRSSNGAWTGLLDGQDLVFNNNEDQASRVLIKDNASTKGSLVMTLGTAFANGGELDIEWNDLYYRVQFTNSSQSPWSGASGADDGNRIVAVIDPQVQNDIAKQMGEIQKQFQDLGTSAVLSTASVTDDRLTLTQGEAKDQSTTNAVSSSTGSVMTSGAAVAGSSGYNGIYYAHERGSGSAKWEFRRASDAIDLTELSAAAVFVQKGLANADQGYNLNSDYEGVTQAGMTDVDKMDQTWVQFTGTGQIQASSGVEKDGNIIRLDLETTTGTYAAQDPAVGDFVALGDLSAAAGTVIQGTVGGMLDLIAGEVNVDSSGVSTIAADAIGHAQIDMAEFEVTITNAAGEATPNIAVANAASGNTVALMMASPLTQVYFNGLRLKKAASEANAIGSNSAHGDYFLKRVDDSNIQIRFDSADFADNEKLQLIICKS